MGGHVEYPKPTHCRLILYEDRIEIENPDLVVPFKSITAIENMDEKKISAKRVVGLGLVFVPLAIVGAMWKRNHIYTVIQFKDNNRPKAIIMDLDKRVSELQGWIYRKMLSSTKRISTISHADSFTIYENQKYGFSLKCPNSWIFDEFDQMEQGYITVVELRLSIENEPPFVTVYVNTLESKHDSFQNFVDQEKKEVEDDHKFSVIEYSETVVASIPSKRLIDVEYEGYKRMVTWTPLENKVYEISYSSKQHEFSHYLNTVEEMINSFQPTTPDPFSNQSFEGTDIKEDPLLVLKLRFAKGEISEQEYERIYSILKRDS